MAGRPIGISEAARLGVLLTLALTVALSLPATSQASFGLEAFDLVPLAEDGSPAMHAGSHPFELDLSLGVRSNGATPDGKLRQVSVDLPPGLLLNPLAAPTCPEAVFLDAGQTCAASTVVGTSSNTIIEPGHTETALVYSIVPPAGTPLRLGMRVAGAPVLMDFRLSPNPPHRLAATLGEWPESVKVFGADLHLWGVPASQLHDGERGGPVGVSQQPFITLPTSCAGPQATSYEVLSWEGDEAAGSALTHDGAEPPNPAGFLGCGQLALSPLFGAALTTEATQSPSGFDFSLEFSDEGLVNPGGFAESQVDEVVVALPSGLSLDPVALAATLFCSVTELKAESLDAEPGEGCPAGSEVGSMEVASPLLEAPLAGVVFAGEPEGVGEAEPIVDLFLVVEDQGLGIIVKQIVELEEDSGSGELFAFAEDLPQLPFGELHVHLDGGPGALLRTPPVCGSYDGQDGDPEPIRALVAPWSGGSPLVVSRGFHITTGPNGLPCPSPAHESPMSEPTSPGASAPPAGLPAPAATTEPDTRILAGTRGRSPRPVFRLRSTESGSAFRCSVDGRRFRACSSPLHLDHLRPGRHVLRVFAIDPAGTRDSSPAVVRFRVPAAR